MSSSDNSTPPTHPHDIAVIGMAGRFPGADDCHQFWENLERGQVSIGEIPSERWDWRACWGDPQLDANTTNSKWGGFLATADRFDRDFFGLSAREVETMDPQQRLALELAWECFEDAGIVPSAVAGRPVGVFTGIANLDYKELVEERAPEVDAYYATGVAASVLANRISYLFDLRGPSMSIDTACSSSLYALHQACSALRSGSCEMALAGGVSLLLTPRRYLGFAKARMMSPSGTVRTFDDAADGMVRGEGGGLLLLKRLACALADGDRIVGVIAGSAVNHSGKTRSLTYPDADAQAAVIRAAHADAGIDAAEVSYLEAHGTGTPKGDPIELEGLLQVFAAAPGLALGSVKPNIGHLEAAAGIAGVIKVLLALQHGRIPPLPHFQQLNSRLDAGRFGSSGLQIVTTSTTWIARCAPDGAALPRLAGVSAFGFAGTNAHLVLREAPPASPVASGADCASAVLCLSARDPEALGRMRARLARWLRTRGAHYALADICAVQLRRRERFKTRMAILADDRDSLIAALEQDLAPASVHDVRQSSGPSNPPGDAVALAHARNFVARDNDDADQLYAMASCPHVPVPTYPFAPMTCWIAATPVHDATAPAAPLLFEETWQNCPAGAATPEPVQLVCVVGNADQRQHFTAAFADHGVAPVVIGPCAVAGCTDARHYHAAPDNAGALARSLEHIGNTSAVPLSIWYCAGLAAAVPAPGAGVAALAPLFALLQAVGRVRVPVRRLILAVPHSPGQADTLFQSWRGLRHALERVKPALSVILIDAGADTAAARWLEVLHAEEAAGQDGVFRYRDGVRQKSLLTPIEEAGAGPAPVTLRRGGCYLITGGMGGLGQRFAAYLCDKFAARVLLVGRSDSGPALAARLEQLQAGTTGQLRYCQADVADAHQMAAVLETLRADWGQLHGVIHAAGIEDHIGVLDKSFDQLRQIVTPKIDGAGLLGHLLAGKGCDFICHFSSLAAVLGDFGCGAYSLANRYLMAEAQRCAMLGPDLHRPHVFAIAWPLIRDGGMGYRDTAERDRLMTATGQRLLGSDEACALFERLLAQRFAAPVVIAGEPGRIRQWLVARGMLGAMPAEAVPAPASVPAIATASVNANAVAAVPVTARADTPGPAPAQVAFLAGLVSRAAAVIKVDPARLDPQANMAEAGFDSIALMDLAQVLGAWLGADISPGLFFSYPTLAGIAAHLHDIDATAAVAPVIAPLAAALSSHHAPPGPDADVSDRDRDAIAIIGMSGRFPGARTIAQFWAQLANAESSVGAIPESRFDWRTELAALAGPDGSVAHWLASMPGIDEFDAQFFDMAPIEAERLDPRERLLLQEAWRALEDAGLGAGALRENVVGMFVGAESSEYAALAADPGSIVSGHNGVLAARLSYFLDLKGPNISLNTACSSGLVAVHQACQSLRAGDTGIAIAAAVNIMLSPRLFIKMGKAGMLSPQGKSHVFDQRADGIVPGEAVVALVLKPLRQALADGDNVHAVIRASGLNYDGKTNGLTAPSGKAQADLIETTYRRARIDPACLGYVVAHGTGTRLGDPVELNALTEAFGRFGVAAGACALTSNKPNIGHTFAVSGLASMVNLIESMRHDLIPASLNWEHGNEFANWAASPLAVNQVARPWPQGREKWGAVSAFGMSGTNAHLVLQQGPARQRTGHEPGTVLLTISAKTAAARARAVAALADALEQPGWRDSDLGDIAHTLLRGRFHFNYRHAVVVEGMADAVAQLRAALPLLEQAVEQDAFPRAPFVDAYVTHLGALYERGPAPDRQILEAIAHAYLQGADPERIPCVPGRTVRLPGYPFARQRYWRDDALAVPGAAVPPARANDAWLQRDVAAPDGHTYLVRLDGSEPFLRDHVLGGRRILPATACLEMARAAFAAAVPAAAPGTALRITDVAWVAPLALLPGMQQLVRVTVTPDEHGAGYRITSTGISTGINKGASAGVPAAATLHSSGRIGFVPAAAPQVLDLERLQAQCQRGRRDGASLYRQFAQLGIDYGESHRTLAEVFVGEDCVLARLDMSHLGDDSHHADVLHPGLLDGAFQASLVLGNASGAGRPAIPFALRSLVQGGSLGLRAWAFLRVTARGAGGIAREIDIDIADESGRIVVTLRGWSSAPFAPLAAPTRPATLLFGWEWRAATAPFPAVAAGPRQVWLAPAFAVLAPLIAQEPGTTCHLLPDMSGASGADAYEALSVAMLGALRTMLGAGTPAPGRLQLLWEDAGLTQVRGIHAMFRTATLEHPGFEGQLIGADPRSGARALVTLLSKAGGHGPLLRWRENCFETLVPVPMNAAEDALPWRAGGTYAIAGGLGGIGRTLAADLLAGGADVQVELLGRAPAGAASAAVVAALDPEGGRVRYVQADLDDPQQLAAWLGGLDRAGRRLAGVAHCAGTLADAFIVQKDIAAFRSVLRPKVHGLVNLDLATRPHALDWFVCCSSMAGVFGNAGQVDYAAANGFIDAYMEQRGHAVRAGLAHGASVAVQWPLWDVHGMGVDEVHVRAMYTRQGLRPLPAEDGMAALRHAVKAQTTAMMVLHGDTPAMLAWLATRAGTVLPHATAPAQARDAAMPALAAVAAKAAELIGVDPADIDPDTDLGEYGMDAVALAALGFWLATQSGSAVVPASMDHERSVRALAHYLAPAAPAGAPATVTVTAAQGEAVLRQILSSAIGIAPERLAAATPFEQFGIDSMLIVDLNARLETVFGALPKTLFFEYQNIAEMAAYLSRHHAQAIGALSTGTQLPLPAQDQRIAAPVPAAVPAVAPTAAPAAPPAASALDIAIVGLAGRYPQARDLDCFWENLRDGIDSITTIPGDRWDNDAIYAPGKAVPGKTYGKWGGFIDGMAEFDPLFFNISPRDAELMDPQERLFLQSAYEAMENAGYTRAGLAELGAVGVFAGVMYQEYQLHGVQESALGRPLSMAGSAASVANRVSYHLNLHGPSMAVDTMCSSSLTALHLACHSILRGECDAAFAGGVNLSLHPNKFVLLAQNRFVSSKGRCESFGEGGDGYVPAEGVGVVMLKTLQRAVADGDHIHGVICASAINHGGKNNGYTVPNPQRQADVVRRALDQAGIAPHAVSYVEAHGTGTVLGDPIEVAGLMKVFASAAGAPARGAPCALGSVKSNIGHAESAAGIAGLTKILLQFRHGQLVPSLHSAQLNANIAFDDNVLRVQRHLAEWRRPVLLDGAVPVEGDRIAGLSSFGAGGSNAHLVVREHRTAARRTGADRVVIVLSARTGDALKQRAAQLCALIRRGDHADVDLAAIAYTLQTGREAMAHRFALVVASLADAEAGLAACAHGPDAAPAPVAAGTDAAGLAILAEGWMREGRLDEVAAAWTAGADLDFTSWYGHDAALGPAPGRVALPGYPFARQRYWYAPVPPAPALQTVLLHLTGSEPFLADHRVQETAILPGVAYVDMVRRALPDLPPAAALQFSQVLWRAPFFVPAGGAVLAIDVLADGAQRAFTARDEAGGTVFCSGYVAALTLPSPARIDLAQLQATLAAHSTRTAPDAAECYALFARRGVVYGPTHRTLEQLWCGNGQVLARLRRVGPAPAANRLDVGMVDGALQAVIALDDMQTRMEVPFSAASIEWFGPFDASMWVHISRAASGMDILVYDEQGALAMAIRGFVSRPLPALPAAPPPVPVAAEAGVGDRLFAPVWTRCQEIAPGGPVRVPVLVLGAGAAQQAAVRHAFPEAPLHFDDDRSDARHVLLFAPAGGGERDLIAAQQDGALAVFTLAQRLIAAAGKQAFALTIVTEHAAPVADHEVLWPAHASMHGLAGVLAQEWPQCALRTLDVEADVSWPVAQAFALPCSARDGAWSYRSGHWHRRNLAALAPVAARGTAYRRHGVYVVIGGAGGVGRVFSEHVIRNFDAQVVWVGRRAQDGAIDSAIAALRQNGRTPLYLRADAADGAAMAAVRDEVLARFGVIDGVVHSALLLHDQKVAAMSEAHFARVLAAKVDTSVQLVHAFGSAARDFMLFFSSFASFSHVAGQANYAAGCAFQDAYARSLARTLSCKVKVINWGFWGNTGIVATPVHRAHMARLGIGSIEAPGAMRALDMLLTGPLDQMAMINLERADALAGLTVAVPAAPLLQARAAARQAGSLHRPEWHDVLLGLLGSALNRLERADVVPRHARWRAESQSLLEAAQDGASEAGLWQDWEAIGRACAHLPSRAAQYRLVDVMLRALPDILTGRRTATEVMFPRGSVALVEGIYQHNAVSDMFNLSLAELVGAHVGALSPGQARILEVGAGTGGTTDIVLAHLRDQELSAAYYFTDVSQAFLHRAEARYRSHEEPEMHYALFDAMAAPAAQGYAPASFDVVVATNVLHATADIGQALRHCKSLLRDGGLLLVNEISDKALYTHLTFGLLDGWWHYADEALRIPGSPALTPASWREALLREGYVRIDFPLAAEHDLGQQLIVAYCKAAPAAGGRDGTALAGSAYAHAYTQAPAPLASDAGFAPRPVLERVRELVGNMLKVDPSQIGDHEPFSDFGLDSISGASLAPLIGEALGVALDVSALFDYTTVFALAGHVATLAERNTPAAQVPPADAATALRPTVARLLAATLKIDPELIQGDEPFADYGMDSISGMRFAGDLGDALGIDVDVTSVFDHGSLNALAAHLGSTTAVPAAAAPGVTTAPAAAMARETDVAIIGVSCQFADAPDLEQLWDNIVAERDCTRTVSADWLRLRTPTVAAPRYRGGFIDGVDQFSPAFFGISAAEAVQMDPQQRLLLTHAWRALQDAGMGQQDASTGNTGVFVACGANEYGALAAPEGPFAMTAMAPALIPNRISYCLNLRGPSEYCDTACSSSLVALHRAVQSLHRGECEQALVGAVNLLLASEKFDGFEAMGFLSTGGRALSFDAAADGFVRSEGVAALVLKPLAAARADGDVVYGVIKGSAVGHGGKGVSLTAPNGAGMRTVIQDACRAGAIDPRTVAYVEAHGIASPVGDAIEVHALRDARQALIAGVASPVLDEQPCRIGSIKPVYGHAELASGLLAVCKVLMAFRHRTLPGVPALAARNESISLQDTTMLITRENRPWEPLHGLDGARLPRRAGVNSFGFGGVNAHVVLEEAPLRSPAPVIGAGPQLLMLSAPGAAQLSAAAGQLRAHLARHPELALADVAFSLRHGRHHHPFRAALVATHHADADTALAALAGLAGDWRAVTGTLAHERGQLHLGQAARWHVPAPEAARDAEGLNLLAGQWCRGAPLDMRLDSEAGAARVVLPPLPLAQERYWHIGPSARPGVQAHAGSDGVEALVRRVIGDALGCDGDALDADTLLGDYGADSMLDLALARRLETELGVNLPVSELFGYRTIAALVRHIATLRDSSLVGPSPEVAKSTLSAPQAAHDALDDLLIRFRQGDVSLADVITLM